jgi:crotonobetainyl-CoA:carnitine CoA-transferase CaiB-like acyl-CoA transferase
VSDVVIESYSPKVFDDRGITYDYLRRLKDDIILVRCSGVGHTGPDYLHKTAGPIVQALTGLTYLSGLPGREPAGWGYSYMDNSGAYYVTMAVLQALFHKLRTGEGQYVDLSVVEAGIGMLGPCLLAYQATGEAPTPPGNDGQPPIGLPENVYPCKGEDRWCAISVHGDRQWRALCECMGRPALADDERYATVPARAVNREALDAEVTAWTASREAEQIMATLQRRGIPCGVVQNGRDLAADPQLAHLNAFPRIAHPAIRDAMVEGVAMHFSRSPGGPQRHGPLLGEHNELVFGTLIRKRAEAGVEARTR